MKSNKKQVHDQERAQTAVCSLGRLAIEQARNSIAAVTARLTEIAEKINKEDFQHLCKGDLEGIGTTQMWSCALFNALGDVDAFYRLVQDRCRDDDQNPRRSIEDAQNEEIRPVRARCRSSSPWLARSTTKPFSGSPFRRKAAIFASSPTSKMRIRSSLRNQADVGYRDSGR